MGKGGNGFMKNKRVFSPYLFALIIICLAFPFVSVSCGDEKICSLNGYELAFGTQVQDHKIGSSFAAINYKIGFILIIILYIAAACYNLYLHKCQKKVGPPD